MKDLEKAMFNLTMVSIGIVILTTMLAITFITISNGKVYDSCRITGLYYIGGDKAIKCEIIEKGK